MDFEKMLMQAKAGDEAAIVELLTMYKPLLHRYAYINSAFDEDLYQELSIELVSSLKNFKP